MLDTNFADWVWILGWFILGSPAICYLIYLRLSTWHRQKGLDVPTRTLLTTILVGVPTTLAFEVGAFFALGLLSYLLVPVLIGASFLPSTFNKDDLLMLLNLVFFGLPIAAAYAVVGADWAEDRSKSHPLSPSQQRKQEERRRKQDPHH